MSQFSLSLKRHSKRGKIKRSSSTILSEISIGDLPLNLSGFLESSRRLLHATTRPSREEIWMLFKISMLGVVVLGVIGFMVRVIFWFINLAP